MAAEWTDENTRIVTELFVFQVRAGNRPNSHLTHAAFEDVAKDFKIRTGLQYNRAQLKNKWDKLKIDFNTFKKLKLRETGGGWDYALNTVKQDVEWWKKAKKDIPGCGKFRKHGLRNEENLRIMFEDITSDGTDAWNPASGTAPPSSSAFPSMFDVDAIQDVDLDEMEEQSPASSKVVRRLGRIIDDKNKKPKTAQVMQEQIPKIGDMHFTYTSIGQPGSMHDTSVLYYALEKDSDAFPHPPKDKYYLVDAGYPNRPGYLAPYKGERYHVPDFHRGAAPNTHKEKFNRIHSSKRNAIERAFGVLKMKWQILLKMPNYSIDGQKMIVAAAMTLHNYVRFHDKEDIHFVRCDRDPDYVPTIPSRYQRYAVPSNASDASTSESSAPIMDRFRDELATAIAQGW